MKLASVLITAVLGLGIAACGGDDDGSSNGSTAGTGETTLTPAEKNQAVIETEAQQAEDRAALKAEVLRKLGAKVKIYEDATSLWNFDVPSGTCFLDAIFAGTNPGYLGQYKPLFDPDGQGGVVIGSFQGTDDAECLKTVSGALGW